MTYRTDELINDEYIILEGKVHFFVLIPHILLMFVGIGFITIIYAMFKMSRTKILITNKRVIVKSRLIRSKSIAIPLVKMHHIIMTQSIWGRMFNYGTITIETSRHPIYLKKIVDADSFQYILFKQLMDMLKKSC